MAAATAFNDTQRETLDALCETFVPSVEVDTMDPVEAAFMRRSALDLQLPAQIEEMLAEAMTADELAAVGDLLHALDEQGIAEVPIDVRTQIVQGMAAADPEAKLGLGQLRG